ncbi:MAG TPA: NGG1p interacting factor NIF3 [Anaerolineae bacterium]|jgi:putative NIF3 family GTP cyclohydrolase 1 type 2|nr:NGG1p interacting factor NIF3 [Anaerolineae bacterium]
MKLRAIYDLAIEVGIEYDPRGDEEIQKLLNKKKEAYEGLKEEEKEFFDIEALDNPYSDTRILAGDPEMEVYGLLAGIDIEAQEVVIADRLREKGKHVNLLLAHHPEGRALAGLADVMGMQADIWAKLGVPINIGDVLIDERMAEVRRSLMPINHNRAVDAAKLLGIAFMNCHTPCDNLVNDFVQRYLDEKAPDTVGDIVKVLREIPEYKAAALDKVGPTILVGDASKRPGKIVVDMTGGTEGPEGAIEKLAEAGVGTIVGMHLGEKLRKKASESRMNVVIAGHIASDAIGMNLFLDKLAANGVGILTTSGLVRVGRS